MLTNGSCILDQSDQCLAVVHLEKAACLKVKLHQLTSHLVFLLLIWILEDVQNVALPLFKVASLKRADALLQLLCLGHKLAEIWQIPEETLCSHLVGFNFLRELPCPNNGADNC